MTVSASQAFLMTQNAAAVQNADKVAQEVTLVEQRVLNTATYGQFEIVYQASLVGNPQADPSVDASLTPIQLDFRNQLQDNGYRVTQDASTGYWKISWADIGPEESVTVYQVQTSVTPGPVQANTIVVLENYFTGVVSPPATARVLIAGTAISGSYVHLVLVTQQNAIDNSSGLLSTLTSAGLGYTNGNTSVTKRG